MITRRIFLNYSTIAAISYSLTINSCSKVSNPPNNTLSNIAKMNQRLYGSAINSSYMNDVTYLQLIKDNCNIITPEWEMKWAELEPTPGEFNTYNLDKIIDFAVTNNLKVRGHTLFWDTSHPKHRSFPPSVQEFSDMYEQVMRRYEQKNVIFCWDVINEVLIDPQMNPSDTTDNPDWSLLKGVTPELLRDIVQVVNRRSPNLETYINDFNIEQAGDKQDKFLKLGQYLAQNTNLTGLGIQSHLIFSKENPFQIDEFEDLLKKIKDIGLKPVITELDVIMYPPFPNSIEEIDHIIGDLYQKYCETAINNGVDTIVTWGITDKFSYIYDFTQQQREQTRPHPFDSHMNPKKARDAIAEALSMPIK
ncbi:Endo-1,4-beta-xylanase [Stanieria cyanosphaera PCC 7437]|uniref:Beta-xylanase n=1 Tax=Stanieria cyanosphaera (strain ATCC 29371 / PCC 7437) TaxID=111780 RepID=K9XS72_STAC7|nr:endo-1,4-beta-xylanase [Stanieria cyanosphaera]AFZ35450.1 Endo-1,4-beta-xylanase [Stanieria cyanosphaera PCC 7437]